ncbi:hypothetical protein ACQY0O_006062 [Thecaphora frezii]
MTFEKQWYAFIGGHWFALNNAPTGHIKEIEEVAKMYTDDNIKENQVNHSSNAGSPTNGQYDDSPNNLQEYGRHRNPNSVDDDGNRRSGDGGGTYDDVNNHKDKDIAGDLAMANGGDVHRNKVNGSLAKTGNPNTSQKRIANENGPIGGNSGSTSSAGSGSSGSDPNKGCPHPTSPKLTR